MNGTNNGNGNGQENEVEAKEIIIRLKLKKGDRFRKDDFLRMTGLDDMDYDDQRKAGIYYELTKYFLKWKAIENLGTQTEYRREGDKKVGRKQDVFRVIRDFKFEIDISGL